MPQTDPDLSTLIRFGLFELDIAAGELRKRGLRIKLQSQPLSILVLLLERPAEIVTREMLYEKLWSSKGAFVEFEHSLNASVAKLRQAIGDSAESPRFIETLPRRGYRFIAPIEVARVEPAVQVNGGAALGHAPEVAEPDHAGGVAAPSAHIRSRMPLVVIAVVLPLLIAAAWLFRPRSPAPAPIVVPLTTDQGKMFAPSFSPDGNQIAYSWDGDNQDNFDIYVKLIGSPATLRLTTNPAPDVLPAWSPDGRQIAFLRGKEIYTISPLGGPERKLAEVLGVQDRFSWSPDGKWLAVAQRLAPEEQNGIFLISADGQQRRRVTIRNGRSYDYGPAFSPDGHRLAYATCTELCTLVFLDVANDLSPKGEPHPLNAGTMGRAALAWTSDSQAVIYDRRLPHWGISNDRLWRIAIQPGSEPQRLDYTDQGARCPVISRAGNRLAYDQAFFDYDIWKWKEGRTEKLIASTMVEESPQYSPDGSKIAFSSARSGNYEIWVANANGSSPAELTFSSIGSGSPRWSPDGRWITYDGLTSDGLYNIFVIDAMGGPPRQVTRGYSSFTPSFSNDGQWIYFGSHTTGTDQIYRVPFAGGERVQMIGNGSVPCESWDGKSLYYLNGPLYVRALDGGPEKQILDFVFQKNYAVTREGIYYIGRPSADGSYPLQVFDLTTSKSRPLGTLHSAGTGLSVSSDGSIAYTVYSPRRADLRLVENFH